MVVVRVRRVGRGVAGCGWKMGRERHVVKNDGIAVMCGFGVKYVVCHNSLFTSLPCGMFEYQIFFPVPKLPTLSAFR